MLLLAGVYLHQPVLLIFGGVAAIVALVMLFNGRTNMMKQKRMLETETVRVDRLKGGFSEVKGRARGSGKTLTSPMSQTPCIYYQFKVEEYVRRGRSSYWRTVVDDRQDAGCLLDDGHGQCAVRIRESELLLNAGPALKSGTFNDASPELEATLQRYGTSSKGWVFNKAMRYTETLVVEGQPIYVIGTAMRRADGLYEFQKAGDLFIVSDKTEEELASRFNRGKLVGFIVGPLIGAVALALIVGSFGFYDSY
jgi:hypothetical protein